MNSSNSDNFGNLPFKVLSQQEIEKINKTGTYARYGGLKDNLYGDGSLVSIGVQIQGVDYFTQTNLRLELKQNFNGHHTFELIADPDEFGEGKAYLLENSRQHLGKRITFFFKQFGKTASQFIGVITQISTQIKDGSKHIILRGKSPSILMENGLHCRSFEEQTFEQIIKEVNKGYPQDLISFDINPNYKNKLPYTVQMNESDFSFLQRLSHRYGENFHYTGDRFRFSAWGAKIVELMEGEDVFDYELKMEIQPQGFSTTVYDPKQSADYTVDSASQQVQSSENPFQQFAINASEKAYNVSPTNHYLQNPNNQIDIQRSVEREKRKRQNLVYMEATSNNPELQIGTVVKMMAWMPGHNTFKSGRVPVESYKIISISHTFADGEGYTNSFVGIPKDLSVPADYNENDYPKADIQHATVTDNKDPLKMGRIRVQFVWQKPYNQQTPWIQIIQPHAGADKGTYINPEIGETVLVAFQGGNAEYPVVLGTAYNGGEIAAYYTEGNDIKVIQTRSGTKIIFNDAEGQGSILIEDPSGNKMFMDGEGNIKVNAPNNFSVKAGKDIILQAGENMHTFVGSDKSTTIGQMNSLTVGANYTVNVTGKYSEFIDGDFVSEAKQTRNEVSMKNFEIIGKEKVSKNAEIRVNNNSGEKSNLF